MTIYGTPTTAPNAAYPGYDSIIVTGTAFFTVFGSPQSLNQDIAIYYRIDQAVSVTTAPLASGLQISPSPVIGESKVNFALNIDAHVRVSVLDLMGREVAVLFQGMQRAGDHETAISASDLPSGAYMLKLDMNDGESVQTKKFTAIR